MRRIFGISLLAFVVAAPLYSEEPVAYQFLGTHFLASYCDCDQEALADVAALAEAMRFAVDQSGAKVLESTSWVFPPNGFTMLFLLSESHASIHTYPEEGHCFVDLFTCGEHCSATRFDAALRSYLKPKRVNEKLIFRNEEM